MNSLRFDLSWSQRQPVFSQVKRLTRLALLPHDFFCLAKSLQAFTFTFVGVNPPYQAFGICLSHPQMDLPCVPKVSMACPEHCWLVGARPRVQTLSAAACKTKLRSTQSLDGLIVCIGGCLESRGNSNVHAMCPRQANEGHLRLSAWGSKGDNSSMNALRRAISLLQDVVDMLDSPGNTVSTPLSTRLSLFRLLLHFREAFKSLKCSIFVQSTEYIQRQH